MPTSKCNGKFCHPYKGGRIFSSQDKKCRESEAVVDSSQPFYFFTKIITVNKATILGHVILVAQTPSLTAELTAGD